MVPSTFFSRRILLWAIFGALAHILLAMPQIGFAAAVPPDEPGFTKALAKAFRAALPGYKVKIRAPLALEVVSPDGMTRVAGLSTLYDFCQRNPQSCEPAVKSHVAQISATFTHKEVAPDRALLRALLRPASYVEAIRKTYAGREEPPIEPFMGDLWVVCAFDMPEAISVLKPGDLAQLGMSREEALARAKENDAALLAPIERVGQPMSDEVGLVATSPYEASRLLAPASWAALAARNGGQLLVAAPGTDVMIYADARQPNAIQKMRDQVAQVAMRATRPLSPTIFRWTPVGWVVVGQ